MNPHDPLSKLLQSWRPESPEATPNFVRDTMLRLEQERSRTWKYRMLSWLQKLGEWMPSPRALVPVAASLVLLLGGIHWNLASDKGRTLAAMEWSAQLNNPLAPTTFAGNYAKFDTHTL